MTKSCKVLFISAPFGAGHIRAAQAIQAGLYKQYPNNIETNIANIFDFFHPLIGQGILRTYMQILKIFPQAYGAMYGWGNASNLALSGRELISSALAERMYKFIKKYNPSIIVCTHATPAGLIAHLVRNNRLQIPAVAVITDYVVHRLWIYPEIQHYIVANDFLKEDLVKQGIARDRIQAMGIPVDEKFSLPINREEVLKGLALNSSCDTILVMGGGAGLLPMEEILLTCDELKHPVQVILVAGNNRKLYDRLTELKFRMKCAVCVLNYVSNIHELMAASDLIITKPGGMTSAEALSCGLPMLIYRPIPGQEEANTEQLLALGAARRANSITHLQSILEELFGSNPTKLQDLRERAKAAGKPQSGLEVAKYILAHV